MEEKQKKDDKKNNSGGGELEECRKKAEEYLNGWKRERADFLNYKKEEMERMGHLVKYANEEMILKLLPILDSFCLAEKHTQDTKESAGFLQIKKQLEDFLAKQGIEAVEAVGKPFDPNTMEIVEEVEGGCEKVNIVMEEIQRGYTLHGKLIRPAKVKVTK